MNYIHIPADMCCCSLGENNDIYVRAEAVFVDRETNVEIQPGFQQWWGIRMITLSDISCYEDIRS